MKTKETKYQSDVAIEPEAPAVPTRQKRMVQAVKKMMTKRNLFVLLFIILAAGFAYYFMQYRKLAKNPAEIAREKTDQMVKAVSKHVVVPNDPNATLATVTDISKLKGQTFFANAKNGDQVIIFPSEMMAVLYRPAIDKIINIGPLSSSPASEGTTASGPKIAPTAGGTSSKPITSPKKP